nr:unnamed protein product [Spirometra erinaceieuropaei]
MLLILSLLLIFLLPTGLTGPHQRLTTECYTQNGPPYNGTLNVTATGEPCLPWSDFAHLRLRSNWNMSVLKENKNYCRNPDDDPRGPWCMVTRSKYGTCAIPHCEHLVDCYEGNGEDYVGDVNQAENTEPCVPWATVIRTERFGNGAPLPTIVKQVSETNSTAVSIFSPEIESFNSCRNPGGRLLKPWCYVMRFLPFENKFGHSKALCNIKQCDRSMHIGVPLEFGDECPPGFLTQVGKAKSEQGEFSTVYCVLSKEGLQDVDKSKFKSFCMFLLNQERETCPKGFDMRRTFMRVQLKNTGKFSLFRQEGSSSIWLALCCTNGSHLSKTVDYPKYTLTYQPSIAQQALRRRVWLNLDSPGSPTGVPTSGRRLRRTDVPSSTNGPLFLSIDRCPPVPGTRRKIFTLGTWKPSNMTATLMEYGYHTSMCVYYDDNVQQVPATTEVLVPHILVEGHTCPQHFSPASNAKLHHMVAYLRTAFIQCKLDGTYRGDAVDKLLPAGEQCFLANPLNEETPTTEGEPVLPKNYICPQGFEKNELFWSGRNDTLGPFAEVRLWLCCRNASEEAPEKAKSKQYPFPSYMKQVSAFATLMLGTSCPEYVDQKTKLTAEFIPVMQTEPYLTLELSGNNNPVDVIDSVTGVRAVLAVCKYSQPREEIGVLSGSGRCDGIGYRQVPSIHPGPEPITTCAVNVTGITFPPGSYCFYKTSTVCPSGLTEMQTSVFEGMVRSFLLQTILSPSSMLSDEKEFCCRSEESLGALDMPLNITSAFTLPAAQTVCQAFKGFNVDQTKGLCVYTPVSDQPESLIVWPRRVFPNNLRGKTEIVVTCTDQATLRSVYRAGKMRNFMMRHRKLWLVPTPMQDFSSSDSMELCYQELEGAKVPYRNELGSLDYCIAVFAACPNEGFEMVAAFPYQQYVICCTKRNATVVESGEFMGTDTDGVGSDSVSTWPDSLRTVTTLGHKSPGDDQKVHDLLTPTELHRDLKKPDAEDGCPAFAGYMLIRRYVKMWQAKRYKTLWTRPSVKQLLNVTAMSDSEEIARRTGLWMNDGTLYAIFCEFQTTRAAETSSETEWPAGNYALPKPVTGCPPTFSSMDFVHYQGRNGFHYSQPIHLAGDFISHSRAVTLHYCQRLSSMLAKLLSKRNTATLPPGHYCVLLAGRKCPPGFTAGSLSVLEGLLQSNESIRANETGDTIGASTVSPRFGANTDGPRIFRDKIERGDTGLTFDRVTYMFCCRADSPSASIPITGFPSTTGPFYLYRAGETCQEIAGLRVTEEYVCMDAPEFLVGKVLPYSFQMEVVDKTFHIEGFTPAIYVSNDHCNVKINLCYYEPTVPEKEEVTVEHNNGSFWPPGSYSLLTTIRENTTDACPPGFTLSLRMNIQPDIIANTFFRPMSFAEYFTQKTSDFGTNGSMPFLHICKRNPLDLANVTSDTARAAFWPNGNYCVLMDSEDWRCPQGLHRYTRQLAELCCHMDSQNVTTPVKLPFVGDFFLLGAFDEPDLSCLPIENTHVEKYVVLLFSSEDPHIHSLCHYMPIEWLTQVRSWPPGNYLLPIGKRGEQVSALSNTKGVDERTAGAGRVKFGCPIGFQRVLHEYVVFDDEFRQESAATSDDSTTAVAGSEEEMTVRLNFCQRLSDGSEVNQSVASNKRTWPLGDYCVIVMGAICPPEMHTSKELVMRVPRSYLRSIRNATDFGDPYGPNLHNAAESRKVTYYSMCCREDRKLLMDLPAFSGGMYLPAGSSLCSSIPGTFIEHEHVTTYLDPTLLDPYAGVDPEGSQFLRAQIMPAPFEEPGIMTLCYYQQMQQLSNASLSDAKNPVGGTSILPELLGPGITATSLWLAGECGCAENAYCRPFKRFSCKCKPGYFGDGVRVCRQVTPLTDSCANLCHHSAECKTRRKHSFIGRSKEETSCVCKDGFVGDGFHCLPRCSAHVCQPFSRCYIRRGVPVCECVQGTIQDGEKCNFDLYSSLQAEKDLPQYMLQHLSCFDDEVVKSLVRQTPKRFFILFAPLKLLKTCDELRSHLVMLPDETAYNKFLASSVYQLTSLNGSVINVNLTDSVRVNGKKISDKPILFTNGRLYYIEDRLEHILPSSNGVGNTTAIAVSLTIIFLVGLVAVMILIKKKKPDLLNFHLTRSPFHPVSMPRASWRGSQGVLMASDALEETMEDQEGPERR